MTYTVQKGDTLSSIATRLGVDWRGITGFKSGNPNLIYVGEVLTVPDKVQKQAQAPVVQVAGGGGTPPPTTQTSASRPDLPNTVVRDGKTYVKQFDSKTNQFTYVLSKTQPQAVTSTQTSGDLNKQPATSATKTASAGSGVVVASEGAKPTLQFANIMSGQVPSASDINPGTGKAYAVNPATGVWDDNYYASVVVPAFTKQLADIGLTRDEAALLSGTSTPKFSDYEAKALAELTPYYERLLKEANYDFDLAKSRLEEDWKTGVRKTKEARDVDVKQLIGTLIPQEQMQTLEDLNRRGLLTTLTAPAAPIEETLTSGEKVSYSEPVGFGGVAGKRLAEIRTSQQARQEAIQRALRNAEEEAGTTYQRGTADVTTAQGRKAAQLEQEKREAVPTLAGSQYQRAMQEQALKRDLILQRSGGSLLYG